MVNKIAKFVSNKNPDEIVRIIYLYFSSKIQNWKVIIFFKKIKNNFFQVRFFRKHAGKNRLIFDIGANMGNKTDIFLKLGCTVVAIEPQQDFASYLRVKYSGNKFVKVVQVALGDKEGSATINTSSIYPGFSSLNKDWQKGTKYHTFDKTEMVAMQTLDNLIDKYGLPYFCKIDVEGYELQVIEGLHEKIPLLNFEFHSDDMKSIKDCSSKLLSLGYQHFNFVIEENSKMALSKWVKADELLEKITTCGGKKGITAWGDIYAK